MLFTLHKVFKKIQACKIPLRERKQQADSMKLKHSYKAVAEL